MRVFKKAICIFVIVALAVSLVPTTASASALTVVGTSFSSAGLTSAEFAASAGPYAIGILAAVAAAYGIKTFVQSDTGQAVKEFFQGLIEKRATATRRSVAEQMEALLGNATIDEDGNINLGRLSFAEARETLLQDDIPITRPQGVSSVHLSNFSFGNSRNYIFTNIYDHNRYVFYCESIASPINNMFFVNSDTGNQAVMWPVDQGLTASNDLRWYYENLDTGGIGGGTVYRSYFDGAVYIGNTLYYIADFGAPWYECESCPTNSINAIKSQNYSSDDLIMDYPDDTLYGVDETLRDQNVGLYDGLVLAPDLINSAVLGGASGQISASDYCGALVDYVSGYDTVVDGVTVTGLPEASTVPRSIDEAPAADTVIDEAPPSTMTGTEAAGLYAFSLDELFPFCLPFDFVKIIEKFNVQPEAPNFDWRFYIPDIVDYTLHIDLSAWNTAAEVCRTMVLIAFVVGLIMLTRQIFIRA